jgi:glycine betaine/proline transport system ATP-binding protein
MTANNAVRFEHVDVVFGQRPAEAIAMLDRGEGRDSILDKTGCLVGVHDASVFVDRGEILVLMGLSGSGKSSLLRCVNGLNKVTRGKMSQAATARLSARSAATASPWCSSNSGSCLG